MLPSSLWSPATLAIQKASTEDFVQTPLMCSLVRVITGTHVQRYIIKSCYSSFHAMCKGQWAVIKVRPALDTTVSQYRTLPKMSGGGNNFPVSLENKACHFMQTVSFQKNRADISSKLSPKETIRIHHECPCRIWKSHPRGRNFNQGRGLPRFSCIIYTYFFYLILHSYLASTVFAMDQSNSVIKRLWIITRLKTTIREITTSTLQFYCRC